METQVNNQNVSLNDLAEGAVQKAQPANNIPLHAMPKFKTDQVSDVSVNDLRKSGLIKPSQKEEPVTGTGNPLVDQAVEGLDSAIDRLNNEFSGYAEQGKEYLIEQQLDAEESNINIDSDDEPTTNNIDTKRYVLNTDISKQQNNDSKMTVDDTTVINNTIDRIAGLDKIKRVENSTIDEPDITDKKLLENMEKVNSEFTEVSDTVSNITSSTINNIDIDDDDLDLLDDEEDDIEVNESSEIDEKDQKKKNEEIMNSLREEVNKNFKPIHNTINLKNFKIGNKKISASKVINEINHTAIECADGVLYEEGKCVRMSALSALEIEKLDPNRRSNSNRNQIMIDRIRMIYDHIIDDEKPNSFISWTKQTGISSINDYFFTLYNATFGRSNIVTYTCNKCDNVFMQTKNINDMIKFRNDDVKNKYYEILHNGIRKLDDPKIELFQISDNYVAALRKPTLYEIFMEPSYINKEFTEKYEDLLLLISYISDIYQIDRANGELLKIDTKQVATDKTLTTKRKIKIYSTILKTLTSDQITALSLKTNDFDDGSTDEDGNNVPNISYQYPSTECPKCGNTIDAIDERPDSMVFTRHQLGLLSKI